MSLPKMKHSLKVARADSAGKKILTALNEEEWGEDLHMPKIVHELTTVSTKLNGSIKQTKAENYRDDMDGNRDEKLRGMNHLLNGYSYHPANAVKEAAFTVSEVFSNYGVSIADESYDVESSYVNSLITDLAQPEIAAAIEKLPGFAQIVEEVKEAQTQFETADQAWIDSKSNESESATELKKDLLKIVNGKLIQYLRAVVAIDSEMYRSLASKVTEIVTEANRNVNN